jgi:hypothetical protein
MTRKPSSRENDRLSGKEYDGKRRRISHGTRENYKMRPTIPVTVLGHRRFIVITGSGISLLQPGLYPSNVRGTSMSPFEVRGEALALEMNRNWRSVLETEISLKSFTYALSRQNPTEC